MLPDPEADIYYVGFVLEAIMSFDAREQSQMANMSDTLEKTQPPGSPETR
jgi:hypothetical protein